MKLDGEFSINAPRAEVWKAAHDPALLARCVPGCESAEQISEYSYKAVVSVKVGPVSARFNLVVEIVDEKRPEMIKLKAQGEEGSRASMLTSESVMTLTEVSPEKTDGVWSSDVTVSGRLGTYGMGLMKKKAMRLSDDFVAAFTARLESGESVS